MDDIKDEAALKSALSEDAKERLKMREFLNNSSTFARDPFETGMKEAGILSALDPENVPVSHVSTSMLKYLLAM